MVKIKQRISLKEGREQEKAQRELQKNGIQDEFQLKGFELVSWATHHKKTISMAIAVIFLGAASWSGYLILQQRRNEQASLMFQDALHLLVSDKKDDEKNKAAAQAFHKLSADFSSSKVAGLAQLYTGYLSLELNSIPEAVNAYQGFLSGKTGELKPLALIGLAYANKRSNKKEEALANFEELLKSEWGTANESMLWESAHLAFELKQQDLAKKRAEELMIKFPDSPWAARAQQIVAAVQKS